MDYVQRLMIGWAGHWTRTLSATPLQPKKWNVCFWIMFNFWWSARLAEGLQPHLSPLSNQKNEMLVFVLWSTSDDQPGLLMNLNPICHPSPAKKMKCSFLDYVQLLMIGRAGQWTRTPSAIPLQTKKWYAHFCITFKFWSLAGLVNGLKPHLQPLSRQKSEMLIFGLSSTSDDWPGWSMDSNPICHLSPGIKWNAHFCIMFNLWWSAKLVNGLKPHLPPLSSQKNEMLIFGLCWTSDSWFGWPMDSNPIHDLSPAKKWNAHFWITFNFWWSARLVDGLKPHLPPLSTHKMKCSFLHYVQLVMIGQAGQWTRTPSAIPLQTKKWYAHFCITFKFWSLAGLVNGLEPHLQPLSSQNNEMLIFGLCWASDSWLGWPIYSNPIHHLSPAKKWNAHFWITFYFWWLARLVNGLKPHLQPLSNQKNQMLIFVLCSNSGDQLSWSIDSNPICHPSPTKKWNACFCITLYFWWSAGLVNGLKAHPPPLKPKKWNANFCITFNFWWSAGLVNKLEPHPLPFSSQKMKCSFLYYIQLVMIGRAGHWTQTPSTSGLKPRKMKCSFLDYV